MELLLGALILLVVVLFVTAPLRRGETAETVAEEPRISELEARKQAKYREIRDAQLDRAAGKLSEQDFRLQDAQLRREAIEILKELDRLEDD